MFSGLQFCIQKGISYIVLESDCLMMIKEFQETTTDSYSLLHHLVQETQCLVKIFSVCHIQHVHRLGNEAAHCMACYA